MYENKFHCSGNRGIIDTHRSILFSVWARPIYAMANQTSGDTDECVDSIIFHMLCTADSWVFHGRSKAVGSKEASWNIQAIGEETDVFGGSSLDCVYSVPDSWGNDRRLICCS